jgi:feruloyl-CoA synthase
MLLSDNAVDHALVQLGAMLAGFPAAPVSPAYSLVSQDRQKLRAIAATLGPSVVYASDGQRFAPALEAIANECTTVIVSSNARSGDLTLEKIERTSPGPVFEEMARAVGPDTIAKVLFTSGSTGMPRGVVNTQRMLCSNQQAIAQCWPLLEARPPIVVDWLPWSHTFGGNHNFNLVLKNGGTLYVDDGKPAPGLIDKSVRNLKDVAGTLYFNVPRGFDMLLLHLEQDAALRRSFFSELDLVFYAAAALPQHLFEKLEQMSERERGARVPMLSAWGATETSPLITSVHFPIPRAGVIGLPAPGIELLLAPVEGRHELRVRGPNVTPGYWERGGRVVPPRTDEQGFFLTGDAGKLEDASRPHKGVVFDGRIAENFKLTSGTWVLVGELRLLLLGALAPLVQDAVITGHGRDFVGALLFPSPSGAQQDEEMKERVARALREHNAKHPHSSKQVLRVCFLGEQPSIDAGEITDKGYINQRAVLEKRAAIVERLYADSDPLVIAAAT